MAKQIQRPKQVLKRIRQNRKHNKLLSSQKSAMRTSIKKVIAAIINKDREQANKLLPIAQSSLDTLARKGIIKRNKANRHKSRLNAKIKNLASI